jgi:inositol-pentakisphosphate 2-kinase
MCTKLENADPISISWFIHTIIEPLLPKENVPILYPVSIPQFFRTHLIEICRAARPSNRTTSLDLNREIALISPDYARTNVPTLCFEIKPKWLFVPGHSSTACEMGRWIAGSAISFTNRDSLSACRFCMHQHLKKSLNADFLPSNFCPMDLRNETRLNRAAIELLKVPGNNLRAWVDGVPVALSPAAKLPNGQDVISYLMKALTHLVPLMNTLGDHQRNLDAQSPKQIQAAYDELFHDAPHISKEQWEKVINQYLNRSGKSADTDATQMVVEYVLSMTLKDCSVLVAMPLHDLERKVDRVTVLDLDPKPVHKIPYWHELDCRIKQNVLAQLQKSENVQ